MRDLIFPRWQGAFLAVFLLADGLYVPAEPGAAAALALGALLAGTAAFLWMKVLAATGEYDLESLCRNRLPHGLTRTLFFVLGGFSICGILRSLVRLSAFWQATAFPGIPRVVSAALLLLVGWRAGRRGRAAVAMWTYPTLFFTGAILVLSLAVTLPDCEMRHLPALVKHGLSCGLLWNFVWLLLPLGLCTQNRSMPALRACTCGALLGGVGLALISLRAWLVLGAGAARLRVPAFAAAGVFSVGDFLQRGEVAFGCALALCEAARVALLVALTDMAFRVVFTKK